MFTPKFTAMLCIILCTIFSNSTFSQTNNAAAFTFKLNSSARTSAGVYKKDSTLVKTLWADKTYAAGTYTDYWDGTDDYGNKIASPDANYDIKVLSNNVNYTWDGIIGNTSKAQTGSQVHRGYYTSMTGMAITGTTAYFCQGYSEGYASEAKFDIGNPQVRLNVFGGQVSTMNSDYVATDGTNVYWAGYDAYSTANSFVHVTKVSDDSQVGFTSGSSYTMTSIQSPKTYTSVIDKMAVSSSRPSGLAVQQSGNYLFVAHGFIDELHVLDKQTGTLSQKLSYSNPQSLSVDGGSLWMSTGTNMVAKYTVNANGTLSAPTVTLQGIGTPGAIQVNGSTIAVIDEGNNQIVRFFNTTTGSATGILGTQGGYANSPDVTNTKFFFNDYRGNTNSFIAFQPDGSFWLGDPGNYRELHFSASKSFIETIMSLGNVYSICVDPNNINRTFAHYLEFAIDYSQPLSGSTGWTLVKNWGYNYAANTTTRQLLNVITLSNGRTYGLNYGSPGGLVELTSTGLRATGVSTGGGVINPDGSLTKFSGTYNTGSSVVLTSYSLTGFDGSNNPVWSNSGTVLASTPANTMKDPNNIPGNVSPVSYNFVTTSNKVIFYNPSKYYGGTTTLYDGYHLGAINKGGNKWLWETQKADHVGYKGAFPEADYFEIGNGVNQYAGSNVNVVDKNIITGYHGEFWKNDQTNYYNHYYEDGLAIGQFGTDGYVSSGISPTAMAGNALSPIAVKDANGNLYLYHGDESDHAGLHRWKISNLSSIVEQYISVPFPSNYTRLGLGYLDLHAGLPFGSPLPNSAGWSKSGTVASNTSQKKYVNDGSPDVFSTFNQSSGSATVQRDLGTNNVSTSWKISGQVTFEGSDVSTGSQTIAYIDVLDASGKILSRFYYTLNKTTGLTTIYGNDKIIVQSSTSLGSTLLNLQPFEVNASNGKITFAYANYAAVSTTIFDPSANWKSPQTLRAYFVSGFPAYGKNIGFMDMKFYKDYSSSNNIPPVADAGSDSTIVLPINSTVLNGIGVDSDGTITNYSWTKVSGPSSGAISNANSSKTAVTSLSQGIYKFELKVIDNMGAYDLDTVQITVDPPANLPPVANAGPDQKITLPVNIVSLAGSGGDADGTVVGYLWTKISGPSSYNIVNASSPVTDISGLSNGVYNFQLEVTDNDGAKSRDTIQITVNVAANIPPVADAGQDITITSPANSIFLKGAGTDSDGSIASYSWAKISGPSSYNIATPSSAGTSVTALTPGIYMFELRVTDNNGAVAMDTIQISVLLPANMPPIANAGKDQILSLPKNTLQLNGSGTDPDGTVATYLWTKISGPTSATITSANYPATGVNTLTQGLYSFELMVTDNKGAVGRDTMNVTVVPSSLPLKLLSFNGQLQNDKVYLYWETTNEKNVLGFDIERMTGSTWEKMGFVPSGSTNVLSNHYTFNDNSPEKGTNYYRLKIVDIDGKFAYSDIISIEIKPDHNIVYQNFPNPFSNFTNIKFEIAEEAPVKIIVYNATGVKVAVLMNEIKQPGVYQVQWNAESAAPGHYYYKVIVEENIITKKLLKLH